MRKGDRQEKKRLFRSIKHHALVGRGPNGRGAAAGAEGLAAAAVSVAGHGGNGGGCCCDIDIVRDLRIGDGDAGVLER
jgi:hypothetical protein